MFYLQPLRPDFRRRRHWIIGQFKSHALEFDARSKPRSKIVRSDRYITVRIVDIPEPNKLRQNSEWNVAQPALTQQLRKLGLPLTKVVAQANVAVGRKGQ